MFECLDRALCNFLWEAMAPETTMFHLHKLKSDHWPLVIRFGLSPVPKVERPFRFLSEWLTHDGFSSLVVENWRRYICLEGSVVNFVEAAKKWNW